VSINFIVVPLFSLHTKLKEILVCLLSTFMFHEGIPFGSKQQWLHVNSAANLTSNIVQDAINNKHSFSPWELCSPLKLKFASAII